MSWEDDNWEELERRSCRGCGFNPERKRFSRFRPVVEVRTEKGETYVRRGMDATRLSTLHELGLTALRWWTEPCDQCVPVQTDRKQEAAGG